MNKIHKILLFCMLLNLTTQTFSANFRFGGFGSENPEKGLYNKVYCEAGKDLYFQEELTSSEEYKKATDEEKQEMLKEFFLNKKAKSNLYITGKSSLQSLALPALATLIAYRYRERLVGVPQAVIFGGLSIFSYTTHFISEKFFDGFTSIAEAIKNFWFPNNEAKNLEFEQLELKYVQKKPWITKELQDIIEQKFIDSRCLSFSDAKINKETTEFLRTVINLPYKIKSIDYDEKKLDEIFLGYSDQTKSKLKNFCALHMLKSKSNLSGKTATYFYGAPGTGKTRAAILIAETLGVEFEIISLSDVESLIGSQEKRGKLLEALTNGNNKKSKNMIILLDDADKIIGQKDEYVLVSLLLTLLEAETKNFKSPYLDGAEIDISNLGIILAGNTQITDPALRSRLNIIEFDNYTLEKKQEIVWKNLLKNLIKESNANNSKLQIQESDFTEEDKENINELVKQDKDPGFRTIKINLEKYFACKILQKYFNKAENCKQIILDAKPKIVEQEKKEQENIDGKLLLQDLLKDIKEKP